jgi:hypothetical protein
MVMMFTWSHVVMQARDGRARRRGFFYRVMLAIRGAGAVHGAANSFSRVGERWPQCTSLVQWDLQLVRRLSV